eukprot:1576750-Ditylum_brightwellii.AAC.1
MPTKITQTTKAAFSPAESPTIIINNLPTPSSVLAKADKKASSAFITDTTFVPSFFLRHFLLLNLPWLPLIALLSLLLSWIRLTQSYLLRQHLLLQKGKIMEGHTIRANQTHEV